MELNELSSIGCLKRMELCKEDINKIKDYGGNSGWSWDCKERKEILIIYVVFLIAKLKQVSGGE